jgi:cholesterol 7-dehydrogenase
LIDAAKVKAGEVVQVDGLGRRFAVWRSDKGVLSVLDAFCPHGGGCHST